MKLKDSAAVKVAVPNYNEPEDSAHDVRVQRAIGEVESGSSVQGLQSPVQPDPDEQTGAAPARVRKSESKAIFGHHVSGQGALAEKGTGSHVTFAGDALHVHASTPEAKARENYVASERERKAEKTASPSGRKTLKELFAK